MRDDYAEAKADFDNLMRDPKFRAEYNAWLDMLEREKDWDEFDKWLEKENELGQQSGEK